LISLPESRNRLVLRASTALYRVWQNGNAIHIANTTSVIRQLHTGTNYASAGSLFHILMTGLQKKVVRIFWLF